jgi:hypothetical protein
MYEPLLYIFGMTAAWLLFFGMKLPFIIYGIARPWLRSASERQEDRLVKAGFAITFCIWLGACYYALQLLRYLDS